MDPTEDWGPHQFLRDDAGSPLGHGYPSGSPLRQDGEAHREAWMRILRADPCSYCSRPGGTVDHVEPQSRPARGLGGGHTWANYAGACESCNSKKGSKPLLRWMLSRRGVAMEKNR